MRGRMIQVVVSLTESAYKEMCENGVDNVDYDIRRLIQNGKVLPKGHGDIVDLNSLDGLWDLDFYNPDSWYDFCRIMDNVSVLVEADEEGE